MSHFQTQPVFKAAKVSWEKPCPPTRHARHAPCSALHPAGSWKGNCSWRFVKSDTWKKSPTYLACAFGRISELQKGYEIGTKWLLIQWARFYIIYFNWNSVHTACVESLLGRFSQLLQGRAGELVAASWLSPNRKQMQGMSTQRHKQSGEFRNCCRSATNWQRAGVGSSGLTPSATSVWSVLLQPGAFFLRKEAGPLSPREEKHTHLEGWNNRFCDDNSLVSVPHKSHNWGQTLTSSCFLSESYRPRSVLSSAWNLEQRIVEANVLLDTLSAPKPSRTSKGKRCEPPTSAISKSNALVATTCSPWHLQAGVSSKTSTQQMQCRFKQCVQRSKVEFLNATRQVQRKAICQRR